MSQEFLTLLERMEARDASVHQLFGNEGQNVGKLAKQRMNSPKHIEMLAEAAAFTADLYAGRRPPYQFSEAMSTDDFQFLFGQIIDRQILGAYSATEKSWPTYAKRATVRDFRQVKRYYVDGGQGQLGQVDELEPYPEAHLSDGEYGYEVQKWGRRLSLSWETIVNDDLDAFRTLPERLGIAAARTEEKFVTELFVDASGPHASFFTSNNGNIVPNNPVFGVAGLRAAMTLLLTMKDTDGEPIVAESMTLVVPPHLYVEANEIVNATSLEIGVVGQGADAAPAPETRYRTSNWIRNGGIVNPAINFYIPTVAETANGDTSWFLFASTNTARPALEVGFLRGYETPQVFRKSPNAVNVSGGGLIDPSQGDFDHDSAQWKLRHVFGGARMAPLAAVASNGSGS